MNNASMNIVICGLSITSSWGNGHATTWRALVKGLSQRGHSVLFLERDVPWYAAHRDLPQPPYCETVLYQSLPELQRNFGNRFEAADLVLIGSYTPEGVPLAAWATRVAGGATAFYDIDTPVTLAKLRRGDDEYLTAELIPQFDIYFSFTGGPMLDELAEVWGAKRAVPLYCSVDPDLYFPEANSEARPEQQAGRVDLGYLGTYSSDRQPTLEMLLIEPARRQPARQFAVAGPQYPADMAWPANVQRIEHLPPPEHRAFYNRQRFTLNVTRQDMRAAGYAPSVRLFEAAACGVTIISDTWQGLETLFEPGREILLAEATQDVLGYLNLPDAHTQQIATAARQRVLSAHTGLQRATELERALAQRD